MLQRCDDPTAISLQHQQHYINGNNYQQQQQLQQQQQQPQNQLQQQQQLQNSTLTSVSGTNTARVTVLLNSSSATADQQQTGVKALTGASAALKYQTVGQQQTSSQTSTLHGKLHRLFELLTSMLQNVNTKSLKTKKNNLRLSINGNVMFIKFI